MAPQSWELVWSILSKIDMDSQERVDIYEALLDESVANAHRGLEHGPRRIGHGSKGISKAMEEWLANVGVGSEAIKTIDAVVLEIVDIAWDWFEQAKKARRQTEVA